jgi:shikimate kinase
MSEKKHIVYLTGFMGSGKTTAGRELADQLGWEFIDIDKKIEKETGKSVPDIFFQNGEPYFRNIESQLLINMETLKNAVVSTGGGTPCYNNNMDFMLDTGLTIYLKMTPESLMTRLSNSKDERPLIKGMDNAELDTFIREKLAERSKFYERADIIIDGSALNINLLLSLIKTRMII